MTGHSFVRAGLRLALPASLAMGVGIAGAAAQEAIQFADPATFPESVTATADGTVYVGSIATGNVYKSSGGATASVFISKADAGTAMVLGVLADEKSGTLWVCSTTGFQEGSPDAELKAVDLASGALKATYAFGAGSRVCNDIAVGADGTVYATSTSDGKIFALKPGASALTEWLGSTPELAGGNDGIAFDADGSLYVNHVGNGTLFRVAMNADGSAGALTQITADRPLAGPDGMRPAANGGLWLAENQAPGRITHVAISGDTATLHVVKEGLESPTSMTQVGDTVWYIQTKFAYMFGDKKGQDPNPFLVEPVSAGGM